MEIALVNLSDKNYPKGLKKEVARTLAENSVPTNSFVSVVLVDKGEIGNHPVLTFVNQELKKPFVFPPDGRYYLGEIIVNAVGKSPKELLDLAVHGALHLVGVHH